MNSWGWWYNITIVTKNHLCWFGDVVNNEVQHSPLGLIAQEFWRGIPQHHSHVELDDFIVMPNHVHGVMILLDKTEESVRRDVQLNVPTRRLSPISPQKNSLSVVVRTYKAAVTTWARDNGHEGFAWLGRFHDHIVRNEADLTRIREYIRNNPLQWALVEENPGNVKLNYACYGRDGRIPAP